MFRTRRKYIMHANFRQAFLRPPVDLLHTRGKQTLTHSQTLQRTDTQSLTNFAVNRRSITDRLCSEQTLTH